MARCPSLDRQRCPGQFAVALALHVGVAINAEDSVLAQAALTGAVETDADVSADGMDTRPDAAITGAAEVDGDEIERFRRALDAARQRTSTGRPVPRRATDTGYSMVGTNADAVLEGH
jgi:hypothetical protein